MKPIILASGSAQRKKLLKFFGFPFRIKPSNVDEITSIKSTCARLVIDNALLKARDIAKREREGIVIGCDTVVYVGNKTIVGKPKSLKDARRILKLLFSKPNWVYSGVAVIDAKTGKAVVDYEKTKIYMLPLTKKEMERYHAKINPFDKAGGFDIEGWGSIFIHRIEGCYSNVIGLPLAKLSKMLKKFGVHMLGVVVMLTMYGCTTEYNLATKQEESLIYSTDKEVSVGEKVAAKLEEQYDMVTDVDVNERVERILKRLVSVSDRKDVVYFVKVIDEDIVNAVSLPGGYIYIFKGLVDKADSDDEIAGVMAHEIAHIAARHGVKRVQSSYAAMVAQLASTQAGGQVAAGVNLAITSLFTAYSQRDEFESDRLGVKYMMDAGYDPQAMVTFLEKLQAEFEKAPARQFSYWRTHPHIKPRIAVVNQTINGKMEFRDYIQTMGHDAPKF